MKKYNKNEKITTLSGIRNNYILKKIFMNLKLNKLLEIIKYNKKYQFKLNKNLNDYKDYMNIEIEIIPIET